jgi:hypothetical protein
VDSDGVTVAVEVTLAPDGTAALAHGAASSTSGSSGVMVTDASVENTCGFSDGDRYEPGHNG